ncbi:MAG: NERD domain-containing protein [Cardiobacteriaceae bacterium]|nr:NERD domain-containing protein [Cardiobacteriaceae bacterium]
MLSSFFSAHQDVVFLKEDTETASNLIKLKEIRSQLQGSDKTKIDKEIKQIEAGIYGEEKIIFELKHSHIPSFVLHNLRLEHQDLTAQIDFLVITAKNCFVIECKNLYGDIEIDANGNFYRLINNRKEGFYSPITQNRRHIELLRAIRAAEKNFLAKAIFNAGFSHNYHGCVVLANLKTVLNNTQAPEEIKKQVIRLDKLIDFIKETDKATKIATSDKQMRDLAEFFLNAHRDNPIDYSEKYQQMIDAQDELVKKPQEPEQKEVVKKQQISEQKEAIKKTQINKQNKEEKEEEINNSDDTSAPLCPKCGTKMILRTAKKGKNIGEEFYGCSNFPKCRQMRKK